jgi:acyl carrier protein
VAGERRLVAYVVPKPGRSLTIRELREHLEGRVPSYMVPSSFVVIDSLPLTVNGKVDRRALPAPGRDDVEHNDMYVAPSTRIEEDVAQIFREVLRIEDIGIYDNFFVLGGHSLLVTQVISRVNRAFQIELSIRTLFDAPTISGLVTAIVESQIMQFEDNTLLQMLSEIDGPSQDEVGATFNDNGARDS